VPDEDDDDLEQPQKAGLRERMKALEEKAKQYEEAQARAERLEWELAVRDSGVDMTPTKRKALMAVHEGDRDPESIRRTAIELGFIQESSGEPAVPELATLDRINQASAGAAPGGQVPNQWAERDQRLQQAKSEAEFDSILREYGTTMAK